MASIIPKKKGNRDYYYIVESARVNGKPRIVSQLYLGSIERIREMQAGHKVKPEKVRLSVKIILEKINVVVNYSNR